MRKQTANYMKISGHERMCLVEAAFVIYPRLQILLDKIAYCHEYSKIAAEPCCMLITGWAGAGKTTLFEYYQQQFPREYTDEGTIVPVLSASIPERPTVRKLVAELLAELGDPAAGKGDPIVQTLRLRKLLKDCGVKIIILDDFHHFIDWESEKVLLVVSDCLKRLIDKTKIPIILVGLPYSDVVLKAIGNSQLKRRFSLKYNLDFFSWKEKPDKKEFRSFLRQLDQQLPLMEWSNLSDPSMAFRFYCGTNGVVAYIMKIVRRATVLAIEQGKEKLDLELLTISYDEVMTTEDSRNNPFSTDIAQLEIVPYTYTVPSLKATNNRVKAKSKELTAFDVLR